MNIIFVFVGGGFGAVARHLISRYLEQSSQTFPVATLVANIVSCIVLGILIHLISSRAVPQNAQLLLVTGFCGGFSTFSTFSGEIIVLLQNGQTQTAMIYILVSVVACVLCIWLGILLAQLIF